MARQPFSMHRGDTPTLEVTITDNTGNAVDITNYDIYFTVKTDVNETTAVIEKTSNPASGITKIAPYTNGVCQIKLISTDTSSLEPLEYTYDVEVRGTDPTQNTYTVIEPSKFEIKKGVTE